MAEASARELARETLARVSQSCDPAVVAESVEALTRQLRAGVPPPEAEEAIGAALNLSRKLYEQTASAAALPLSQAALEAARRTGNRSLIRWALTACGVIVVDNGDPVRAMEHYIEALRIAVLEDNIERMAGLWSNMGIAGLTSRNYTLAQRCYLRALALLQTRDGPVLQRFITLNNLAHVCYLQGRHREGLQFGERALLELTPEIQAQDPFGAVLLRRNLVMLHVGCGNMQQAAIQIAHLAKQAPATGLRARLVAEIARAVYEAGIGQFDLALTRIDKAIAEARLAPHSLLEALIAAVRCEEASGNAARALLRLEELSDHVYRANVAKAREYIKLAGMQDVSELSFDPEQDETRARLVSQLVAPRQPEGWKALQRLGVSAVMPMDDSGWHGMRVGALCRLLAEADGMSPLQARELGLAAEVHDIGMSAVPAEILSKRGTLNKAERDIVERHAAAGAEMLAEGTHPRMLLAQEIARYHHARFDGTGYPARVGGEFIPYGARICSIADAYDMMVCGNGNTKARSMGEALEELRRHAGRQFDPALVECFDDMIRSEAGGRGLDLSSEGGMEDFQDLVLSLKEDRGFA